MYMLTGLAKATQDDKLRAAAPAERCGQVHATRHTRYRGGSARRLAGLRILRGRRAAQAY